MAIQPPQRFELDDLTHVEREARTIYAPGATPGDVLVVQSDHSLVAAPGSGSRPVIGCVIGVETPFNIDDFGFIQYAVWDTIYDNIWDEDQLDDFPDGIGLTGLNTDTIETTEAGTWSFSLVKASLPFDATWGGELIFGNFNLVGGPNLTILPQANPPFQAARLILAAQTVTLPAGAGFSVGFYTEIAATVSPLNVGVIYVAIARLA